MSKPWIAMTGLSLTENLGSQMWHFASLVAIARRSGHRIVFFKEHAEQGKGLRLHKHFSDLPLELLSVQDLSQTERNHLVYPIPPDIIVDSQVFKLDVALNFNFTGLFISYRYWYPRREEIKQLYRFSADTLAQAAQLLAPARAAGRPVVAVHVRRDDYINGLFVNVNRDYYDAAFAHFSDQPVTWLIFSDDLPWCRQAFADLRNLHFSDGTSPVLDMAAMSLCDHHIIANSSFGFWGAFLNPNPTKIMICPARTLKSDRAIPHVNYAWHPDEFIGLDVGNV